VGHELWLTDGQHLAVTHRAQLLQDTVLNTPFPHSQAGQFIGFVGETASLAFAARFDGKSLRTYQAGPRGWRSLATRAVDRAEMATWGEASGLLLLVAHGSERYSLEALGPKFLPPIPRQMTECGTELVRPEQLVTGGGATLVRGTRCGDGEAAIELWTAEQRQGQIVRVPTATNLATLDAAGAAWAAGGAGAESWIGRLDHGEFVRDPVRAPIVALAVQGDGTVWAAERAMQAPHSIRRRLPGEATWSDHVLPTDTGPVEFLRIHGDTLWIRTEKALLSTSEVSRRPWGFASTDQVSPASTAPPYAYHRASGRFTAEVPDGLVGSDCPHFVLVDHGSAPHSPVFERAIEALVHAKHPRLPQAIEAGIRVLREADEVDAMAPHELIFPTVSFEMGTYYFGFSSPDLLTRFFMKKELVSVLGDEAREVCANPINSTALIPQMAAPTLKSQEKPQRSEL